MGNAQPPFTPGKDIHAHSQASIGQFTEDLSRINLTEEDDDALRAWNFSSNSAFNKETIGVYKEELSGGTSGTQGSSSSGGGGCGSGGGASNAAGGGSGEGSSSCCEIS
jgi:hypothetical protein